jgi:hypothetical protein
MLMESDDPEMFHAILTRYRDDLLLKNKDGVPLAEAGAVALGSRLSSSHFPGGYDAISYGRGTWLMHMLRTMMRDAERQSATVHAGTKTAPGAEEPFIRALRKLRTQYEGKAISTRQFLEVMASELPAKFYDSRDRPLNWFLEGWIYGTALPTLELRSVKHGERDGSTVVSGILEQKDAPDDLVTPVPLYAVGASGRTFVGRVFADGPETPFHVTAPPGTKELVIDPEHTVLSRTK